MLMMQNVVLFNSRRQPVKMSHTNQNSNTSTKLQTYLQHNLCPTYVTPGPRLHFVKVQICF
jgi:hypothetical protein